MTYAPAEGWTPKLRIGPSVLDQAARCMRSWGLRYLLGYDSDDPTWADLAEHTYDSAARLWRRKGFPDYPSRKRSCALGTEAHAIVECHYLGTDPGAARWASFPGQVAQAWLDVMPRPDECDEVYTEIGVALWSEDDGPPIEGTSDLLLKLRVDSPQYNAIGGKVIASWDGWLVGDWKSTSAWKYQKSAATLFTDRQGVVYPLAAMRRLNLEAIPGRWAYSLTDPKARRQARATDFVQTRENAEELTRGYFVEAAVLKEHFDAFNMAPDPAAYVNTLPADTSACDAYGGCPHAWDRGGACTARRSLGSRVQAACAAPAAALNTPDVPLESLLRRSLRQEGENMASPWMQAKQRFQAQQAASANAPTLAGMARAEALASARLDGETHALDPQPAPPAPADISAEPEETTAVETPAAMAEAPPRRRGRPPGAKNKTPEPAPCGGGGLTLAMVPAFPRSAVTDPPQPAPRLTPELALELANANVSALDDAFAGSAPADALNELTRQSADEYAFRAGDRAPALTLADIAAVAKATGAEISIFFKGGAL